MTETFHAGPNLGRLSDVTIIHGDCIEAMAELAADSVDAIVTDPPYGLGFMGKAWDELPPGLDWAKQCLRVLKPGGHLLAFGGTRTWHRLAVAVEDAGFEIRDSIAWLYGSGFPKSLNVSNSIKGGLEAPETPESEQWSGWGTALKPAFEPVVVGRKPLVGTVAANVLAHGTGALNIDGCRIGMSDADRDRLTEWHGKYGGKKYAESRVAHGGGVGDIQPPHAAGRWPANVVLDADQAAALDEQSGITKSTGGAQGGRLGANGILGEFSHNGPRANAGGLGDSGGASRFYYVAKAPKKERPVVIDADGKSHSHATVKPLTLMRWLVRLVTPPGGTTLDPFAGSGTTVEAALLEDFRVIGIERETDYLPMIQQRIARCLNS